MNAAATGGMRLAQFAAALDWRALPAAVRGKVIDHVIDTAGLMLAGGAAPACAQARRAAIEWGSGDDATIIGEGSRSSAATAAFLNALYGRIHAFDDTYERGTLHAGNSVIAAALALADKHACDGATFLEIGRAHV